MSRFTLSDEQQAIVRCPARTLLVSAGAGTGKTSTLEAYAQARPRESILYLAFNQAIRSEAQRRFPRNVRCLTTHGLAYGHFGKQFDRKLGNPKPYHLSSLFAVPMVFAGVALAGLMRWLYSADQELAESHFIEVDAAERGKLLDLARRAWHVMCDTGATGIPMPHDGYLKLYQLSRPELDYDVILFDEAQDANAAVLDVINRQDDCARVFVGDRRQAIYGFRGAVNAMDAVTAEEHLQLTGSFRYGQGVADVANAVLSAYSPGELHLRGLAEHWTRFIVPEHVSQTILARTNAGLFSAAVEVLEKGQAFGFVGGAGSYRFNALLDADALRRGQGGIKDPFLRAFESYGQLKEYAESVEDGELRSLISIVDRYRDDLPALVGALSDSAGRTHASGPVTTLATAHRAKGLEWPAVRLWEDFTDMRMAPVDGGAPVPPESEEINLLYVAVTRAREKLALHTPLLSWLSEQNPALHADITQGWHRPNLPPRTVSGLDFGAPSIAAEEMLDDRFTAILRDAPQLLAEAVGTCAPNTHHLLKLVFDLTHHLATGDLVIQRPEALPAGGTAAPKPVSARKTATPSKSFSAAAANAAAAIHAREVLPLWMEGKGLETISEQLGVPIDALVSSIAKTLNIDRESVIQQDSKRTGNA